MKGFTLIELITVVLMLGIMAATAAPRFLGISSEAKASTVNHIAGVIKSAVDLTRAKAIVNNKATGDNSITIDGQQVGVFDGYPRGYWSITFKHLLDIEVDTSLDNPRMECPSKWCVMDWKSINGSTTKSDGMLKIFPKGHKFFFDDCGVYYRNRQDGNEPKITIVTECC